MFPITSFGWPDAQISLCRSLLSQTLASLQANSNGPTNSQVSHSGTLKELEWPFMVSVLFMPEPHRTSVNTEERGTLTRRNIQNT